MEIRDRVSKSPKLTMMLSAMEVYDNSPEKRESSVSGWF